MSKSSKTKSSGIKQYAQELANASAKALNDEVKGNASDKRSKEPAKSGANK